MSLQFDLAKTLVENFETKHGSKGFTFEEIDKLKEVYKSKINKEKFDSGLRAVTCAVIDGEAVIYRCDVELAMRLGLENRDMRLSEFD